jgi:CRP/FNR family nitrogen fixation transcriptional regulator
MTDIDRPLGRGPPIRQSNNWPSPQPDLRTDRPKYSEGMNRGVLEKINTTAVVVVETEAMARRHVAVDFEMRNLCFAGEGHQRSLPANKSVLKFAGGQQIYGVGEKAVLFFKLASGIVRTCKFLNDGRRQIDAFYLPGYVFGLELSTEYSLSAESICNSNVISYRRRDLEALAARSEEFSQQAFSYAMQNLARAQQHAALLGKSAIERLAAFLTDRAACLPEGQVLTLGMPRRDIADYLGLTIETISRSFAHLEARALIELQTARQIRLKDSEGLRRLNS